MTTQAPPSARFSSGPEEAWAISVASTKLILIFLLVCVGLGAACGWFAAAAFGSPTWEASGLIRVGQVGTAAGPQLIEPLPTSVSRMRNLAFPELVLDHLGLPRQSAGGSDESARFLTSFRVLNPRGSDLLAVKVGAANPERAEEMISAVVEVLARTHAQIGEVLLEPLRAQARMLERELEHAAEERDALIRTSRETLIRTHRLAGPPGTAEQLAESILLGSLLRMRDSDIRRLRDLKAFVDDQLSPIRTFPTALLADSRVVVRRIPPERGRGAMIGAALGAVLGAAVFGYRRHRARRASASRLPRERSSQGMFEQQASHLDASDRVS
jgi:hypothetical protein